MAGAPGNNIPGMFDPQMLQALQANAAMTSEAQPTLPLGPFGFGPANFFSLPADQQLLAMSQFAMFHPGQAVLNPDMGAGAGPAGQPDDDEGSDDKGRGRGKRPHLQGRFSGRLQEKEDEKRLVEECKLIATLVGGVGKRGDRSRSTLAKIVRGIASGEVRHYLSTREVRLRETERNYDILTRQATQEIVGLKQENERIREDLRKAHAVMREKDIPIPEPTPAPPAASGPLLPDMEQALPGLHGSAFADLSHAAAPFGAPPASARGDGNQDQYGDGAAGGGSSAPDHKPDVSHEPAHVETSAGAVRSAREPSVKDEMAMNMEHAAPGNEDDVQGEDDGKATNGEGGTGDGAGCRAGDAAAADEHTGQAQ